MNLQSKYGNHPHAVPPMYNQHITNQKKNENIKTN